MIAIFFGLIIVVLLLIIGFQMLKSKGIIGPTPVKELPTYVMYETAPRIADKWNDVERVGMCNRCGLDDAPIVIPETYPQIEVFNPAGEHVETVTFHTGDGGVIDFGIATELRTKCKWCAEGDNLNYHLRYKSSR